MMTSSSWTKEENIQHQQDQTPPLKTFIHTFSQTTYRIEWNWGEDIKAVHFNAHHGIVSALKVDGSKHSDQIPASTLRNLDMGHVRSEGSTIVIGFTTMQDTNKAIDPSSILIIKNLHEQPSEETDTTTNRKSRKRRDKAV